MSHSQSQPSVASNVVGSTPYNWEQIMELRKREWPELSIPIEDIPQLLRQWLPFEGLEVYPPGFASESIPESIHQWCPSEEPEAYPPGFVFERVSFETARYAILTRERIATAEQLAAATGMPYIFNPTTGTIDLLPEMDLGPSVDEESEQDEGTPLSSMPDFPSVPQTAPQSREPDESSSARDSGVSLLLPRRSTDCLYPSPANMAFMSSQEFGNRAGAHNYGMAFGRRPPPGPLLTAQLARPQASQPPSPGTGLSTVSQRGQAQGSYVDVPTSQQQGIQRRQDSNVPRPPVPLFPGTESSAGASK